MLEYIKIGNIFRDWRIEPVTVQLTDYGTVFINNDEYNFEDFEKTLNHDYHSYITDFFYDEIAQCFTLVYWLNDQGHNRSIRVGITEKQKKLIKSVLINDNKQTPMENDDIDNSIQKLMQIADRKKRDKKKKLINSRVQKTGELESITALDPRQIRIWVDDVSTDILQKYYYSYTTVSGKSYIIPSEDMVHLKNWHLDDKTRMLGIPVRDTLREYFTAAKAGQETQNSFYKNGLIISGVLNYVGDLNDEKKAALLEQVRKIGTKNKIIPLPEGMELKPLTLSLQDQQYLSTRQWTSTSIAAAYGVSPNQLNDYSKGSYANATAQQLSFLVNTLEGICKQYEDELTYKLLSDKEISEGLRIDIDTEAVLRSTPDVLASILTKYVAGSIMTINEARNKANLPPVDGGDKLVTMPGSGLIDEVNENAGNQESN